MLEFIKVTNEVLLEEFKEFKISRVEYTTKYGAFGIKVSFYTKSDRKLEFSFMYQENPLHTQDLRPCFRNYIRNLKLESEDQL